MDISAGLNVGQDVDIESIIQEFWKDLIWLEEFIVLYLLELEILKN